MPHVHASALIAAGVDILTASRRRGHASPSMTLEIYGHIYDDTDSKAAEVMEATLAKARTE